MYAWKSGTLRSNICSPSTRLRGETCDVLFFFGFYWASVLATKILDCCEQEKINKFILPGDAHEHSARKGYKERAILCCSSYFNAKGISIGEITEKEKKQAFCNEKTITALRLSAMFHHAIVIRSFPFMFYFAAYLRAHQIHHALQ